MKQRTEIINIKFNDEIDKHSFLSKNLYNYANYIIRQEFITNKKWIRYNKLNELCKNNENYKLLPSQTAQNILKLLDINWQSFFKSIKTYSKNKTNYSGKPNLPKYKKKDGRNILIYPFQNLRVKDEYINIPKTKYKFKIRDKIKNIKLVRIVPMNSNYKVEIVYETNVKECNDVIQNVISIDIGVNNFSTLYNNLGLNPLIINGKNIKSINQYYNKKKSNIASKLKLKNNMHSSKRLERLTMKRNNKVKDYLHKVSKFIINYCAENKIDTVIIGHNINWKTEVNIGKRNNQNFVSIPHTTFINMIKYKCEDEGIKCIITEESYTSKIDHLAKEELCKHDTYLGSRVKRGVYQSSVNKLINSDVNGSIGIMRKVIGDDLIYPIQDLVFNPIKINIF